LRVWEILCKTIEKLGFWAEAVLKRLRKIYYSIVKMLQFDEVKIISGG